MFKKRITVLPKELLVHARKFDKTESEAAIAKIVSGPKAGPAPIFNNPFAGFGQLGMLEWNTQQAIYRAQMQANAASNQALLGWNSIDTQAW